MKDSQSHIPKLVLTCDLGASQTKSIAQLYPEGVPQVIAMSPEVADVVEGSVANLHLDPLAQDSAWVGIGEEYFILGSLAKTMFAGTAAIRDLKYHYAQPKIAALLWLACRRFELSQADVYVHLLLPPGESKDGQSLQQQLFQSLKTGISTPTGRLKLKQRNFMVSLEGTGVLSHHRRMLGNRYSQITLGMLMLGYRNASFTLIEKGSHTKAEATDLGMNWLIQRFVDFTAVGLSKNDFNLTKAIVEACNGEFKALRSCSRKNKTSDIESDLVLFQESLSTVRQEYCRALVRWIRNIAQLDEVLISGGTASIVKAELIKHFQKDGISVCWNGDIKFPQQLDTLGLCDRLADAWAAHITYIKILDASFKFDRQGSLIPDKYQSTQRPISLDETWRIKAG